MNGKRKQKTETLSGVTKKRAEEIYAERIKTARELGQATVECSTMNALFDRYMQSRRSLQLAASTLQRYEGLMKVNLRPSLGTKKPSDLKANQILSATDAWAELKTSGRTRLHAYNLLHAVLNRAVIWDIIPFSPTAKISTEDRPKAKRPKSHVLTESELGVLLRQAKDPSSRSRSRSYVGAYSSFFPAVALAAYTGARRGETLAIRWSDLDLEAKTATISRSLADTSGGMHFKDPKNEPSQSQKVS